MRIYQRRGENNTFSFSLSIFFLCQLCLPRNRCGSNSRADNSGRKTGVHGNRLNRGMQEFFGEISRFLSGGGGARKSKREVQGGMEWSTGLEACRHLGATHRGLWQTLRERDRKVKFMAVAREQQALLRATNRLRITLGFAFFLSAFRLLSELSVVVPATHPPDA